MLSRPVSCTAAMLHTASLLAACIVAVVCLPAFGAQAPPAPASRVPPAKPPAAVAAEQAQAAAPSKTHIDTPAQLKADCDKREVEACSRLADRYSWAARYFNKEEWKDDGLAADAALEHKYRLRACELGSVRDCGDAGSNFVSGTGVTKDVARGIPLLARACDGDEGSACAALADVYKQGIGVKANGQLALELHEKTCRLGAGVQCWAMETAISDLYPTLGLPVNSPPRPLGAEVATCRRGDANACMRAALRYYNGKAPDVDGSRAAFHLAAACDGGIGDACWLLGVMLAQGVRLERDDAAAAANYLKGCNLRHGTSCTVLGDMLRRGVGVPKDAARADQLRQLGCSLESAACPEDLRKAAAAQPVTAATPAAPAPFTIVRAQLGNDTVASIQKDITARGGSPSAVYGPHNTINALSGDFRDGGPDIMAVNYDFDAASSAGRLVTVTIVRMRPVTNGAAPYASLVAERKAAIVRDVGPLQQKSPTEFTASARGVQATLYVNPDTGYLHERYQLTGPVP
ncbi:MAG: tetratricopeptide repeat protein [Steroidobacteraceae bacterium]